VICLFDAPTRGASSAGARRGGFLAVLPISLFEDDAAIGNN
jgi:hypothetical protein